MIRPITIKTLSLFAGTAAIIMTVLTNGSAQPLKERQKDAGNHGGWMKLETHPDGASLFIDGNEKNGVTPLIVEMPQGSHDLRVKLVAYQEWRDSVQVYSAETTNVLIHLGPLWTQEQYERQERVATNVGISLGILLVFIGLVMK